MDDHYRQGVRRDVYRPHRPDERLQAERSFVRTITSESLFSGGEHEIGIDHHGALYRLKITRQGKLILNK